MTTVLSLLSMGVVVLYLAFTTLAGIAPAEAASATVVAGVLAALLFVRYLRLDYELRSQAGDPLLRSRRNRQRERRGF
jgi:hypothetical protein